MTDHQISTLTAAWLVSLTAIMLLFVALAIEPIWNTNVYLQGLAEAIMIDHF
ncbi:MAG TPA: hypothetical protein VME45_20875 [Stellaceae bacterium]|nr:hypothetical protein [Stellaceae bacterium]